MTTATPSAASAGSITASSVTATPVTISIKSLLEAGAHFGHQTHRWNPKMGRYIYGERNGIHVINLDLTMKLWEKARKFVVDTVARGGSVLFVGTKQQTREIVQAEAARSGSYFVTDRWLGGTLSNFSTIRTSIERMKKMEELLAAAEKEGSKVRIVKKERVRIGKQLEKLQKSLGGIREMRRVASVVVVTDIVKESIAVAECRRLHVPVIGFADTNSDPELVDFPIPTNDDAPRVCKLFVSGLADAIMEGKKLHEAHEAANGGNEGGHGRGGRRMGRREDRAVDAPAPQAGAQGTAS